MKREILMSSSRKESWVAILEDDRLVELMLDRPEMDRIVGDVFLGRVEAVLPGIQAAFVDIGTGKAGFLHVSDVALPEEYRDGDEDGANGNADDEGNGGGNGDRPPIQELVQKGEEVLVQVRKEAIGTKGPRVTSEVSLPGRFLVYMPFSNHVGVSRKIEDREERTRLRELARDLLPDGAGGLIVRTVGEELNRAAFQREFESLHGLWGKIRKKARSADAPAVIHRDAQLVSGIIRDVFTDKVDALVVDSRDVLEEVKGYLEGMDPELAARVRLHDGKESLFDAYGIEEEIQGIFRRKVNLPSGGYIVIEPTEALVSVDVNTGRYTGKKDPERTILRTNLDAAREIARQLRLRDIGGIIVCDFIDMDSQENRDRIFEEFREHLAKDRARTKAFAVSELGLVEMTRQRVRPSLYQSLTELCSHCGGTGRIYTPETVVRRIQRGVLRAGRDEEERSLVIRVHPAVALHILESEPNFLRWLSDEAGIELDIRDDPLMLEDEFRLLAGPAETDVTDRYVVT